MSPPFPGMLRKAKGFTMIELLVVVAIVAILAAVAIPQFSSYLVKSYNSSALSDLMNIRISQESLHTEFGTYGRSEGPLLLTAVANSAGPGTVQSGSSSASTATLAGAAISGPRQDGTPCGIGIGISNGVAFLADTEPVAAPATTSGSYIVYAKHNRGNRVFALEKESSSVFYVQNDSWISTTLGALGAPAAGGAVPTSATQFSNSLNGGGAPNSNWSVM